MKEGVGIGTDFNQLEDTPHGEWKILLEDGFDLLLEDAPNDRVLTEDSI